MTPTLQGEHAIRTSTPGEHRRAGFHLLQEGLAVIRTQDSFSIQHYHVIQSAILALKSGRICACAVDLSGTREIDSFGIALLMLLKAKFSAPDHHLFLSGASQTLSETLLRYRLLSSPSGHPV